MYCLPTHCVIYKNQSKGDPGQRAVDAEDAGGDGAMQTRASPPTGNRGETGDLLQSQTAAEEAQRVGTSHPARSLTAGGMTKSECYCMQNKVEK